MAKRSNKRSSQSEKDNGGCMWGLISMFDFRQGHSSRKLLSDRKRGSGRRVGAGYSKSKLNLPKDFEEEHESSDDDDDSGARRVNSGMSSVKILIEEEMTKAHLSKEIPSDELERRQSELGVEIHVEKKSKKSSKNRKVAASIPVHDMKDSSSLETSQSVCSNMSEMTPFNFDLASLMLDFYADKPRYQEEHADSKSLIDLCALQTDIHAKDDNICELDSELAHKHSILQKALGDVADVLLSQKFGGVRSLADNRAIIQSKEFMDALDVLSSNKDLFLKLLQDPNSFLLKHIQDLCSVQSGKPSEVSGAEIGSSEQRKATTDHKLFHKQNGYSIFRRKDKSKETKLTDKSKETKLSKEGGSSQALSKIVVLKPSPPARILNPLISLSPSSSPQSNCTLAYQEETVRHVSHFSLKEIKRRLRHAIGDSKKERHLISMDAVLHKIPYGSKDSVEMGAHCLEDTSQSSMSSKKKDKKTKLKDCQPNIEKEVPSRDSQKRLNMTRVANPLDRESILYEEARKRLAEMLEGGEQKDSLPNRRISKPLGRILSFPDYNLISPRFSPGRETLSPRERIFSPKQQLTQENANGSSPQNVVDAPCLDRNRDDESQAVDLRLEHETKIRESICTSEDIDAKGRTVVEDIEDNICIEECDHLDVPLDLSVHEAKATLESCKEEESPPVLEARSTEDDEAQRITTRSVSTSPCSLLIHKQVEDPESIMGRSERPSPISVLEPLFTEDAISPEGTSAELEELLIQPLQLHYGENEASEIVLTAPESEANLRIQVDEIVLTAPESEGNLRIQVDEKEARFAYIRAVLESSGLCCNGVSGRWHSTDQLLDPSLFDEVGISCDQLPDEPKLLFDCINEVVLEIQEKFFSCTPWMTLFKTHKLRFPRGEDIIQEVRKRIECRIRAQFPSTLDQIVGKDLEGGNWMDLQMETESVLFETGETILEYIMEETILELWD